MRLIAILFITGAVLLPSDVTTTTCGKRMIQHQERYSNDHSTDEGDWPWNAAIYQLSDESKTYKCAGTLIHSSVVLTAARCVFENGRKIIARRLQVELGRHNLNDSGSNVQEFQVFEIIPHPAYNSSTLENDIALIRLLTEATLNDYVQPVCLWQSNLTDLSEVKSEVGTVIGWGIIQTTTPQRSHELQQVLMPVITKSICVGSRKDFFSTFLYETSFCAGFRDGTNPCNGDSGGAMVFNEKGVYSVRGIVSRGVPKDEQINVCDPYEYFIFTDVVHFLPWIKELVPELNRTTSENASAVCQFNEEYAEDLQRCEESCEEYGDPLCVGKFTEGRCYCKEGFIRLKAMGICVAADNRACRAMMPPTKETCDRRQNERLSEWLHDEPCANTCQNYNVHCNVTPPAGIFYGPHCVCQEGFARLPNGKCVDVDDAKCKEFWNPNWNPTTPTPPLTTTIPTKPTTATPIPTSANVSAVCQFNEEYAEDLQRCEESCEEYGDPLCVGKFTEGRCYCKEGFIRLKAMGICVAADNRACRAMMPPTKETCDRRQNERLSEWLHDEPCANTCQNYNVPCNVTPPAGIFYGPHCVCIEGFARLPNGKCVDVDDAKCKEFWNPIWNPTTPTPPLTTTIPTKPTTATPIPTSANVSAVCGFNEEFSIDEFRCEQSCEEYGNPLCVFEFTEGKCYCRTGFIRLKAVGLCVAVDNLACRAKMPPTNETCDKRQNEELSIWLHDEPCANTCENYNVPCDVTPPAGMFYGPHCVCREGFARLPSGKCVDVDDTKCKELWTKPTTTTPTIPITTTSATTIDPCNEIIDITLYGDPYYKGASYKLQMKQNRCYDLMDMNNLEKKLSSINVNACVILYQYEGCTGEELIFHKHEPCSHFLGDCSIPFNDHTASIRLCPNECEPETCTPSYNEICITFYHHANYKGASNTFKMKQGECYDLTDCSDRKSSVTGNACVILYDEFGCTGKQFVLREDAACRRYLGHCSIPFNDKTSSARLC